MNPCLWFLINSVVQGQSSGTGLGDKVPQKLKLFAHLLIFAPALCGWSKILEGCRHKGGQHKAKNCGCLYIVNTNGLTPVHSSTQINNRPATNLNTLKSVELIQYKDINN